MELYARTEAGKVRAWEMGLEIMTKLPRAIPYIRVIHAVDSEDGTRPWPTIIGVDPVTTPVEIGSALWRLGTDRVTVLGTPTAAELAIELPAEFDYAGAI